MIIIQLRSRPAVSEALATRRTEFADGALGAAGHVVDDVELRELSRQVAAGEISGDEAIRLGMERLHAR